jgi:hypothetical protein
MAPGCSPIRLVCASRSQRAEVDTPDLGGLEESQAEGLLEAPLARVTVRPGASLT